MPTETVAPQAAERSEAEGEIGTLSGVFESPEIVVDEVETILPAAPVKEQPRRVLPGSPASVLGPPRMVEIRVNEDVTDMSYIAGNTPQRFNFKAGHRYRVPEYIAVELERSGKVYH